MFWDMYKVRSVLYNNKPRLVIARGKTLPNGKFKTLSQTDDRTDTILLAVISYFRNKIVANKNKKVYNGINTDFGKLIYIKPGYTFRIVKEIQKE